MSKTPSKRSKETVSLPDHYLTFDFNDAVSFAVPNDLIADIYNRAKYIDGLLVVRLPSSVDIAFFTSFAMHIYNKMPSHKFVIFREDMEYTVVNDDASVLIGYHQGHRC